MTPEKILKLSKILILILFLNGCVSMQGPPGGLIYSDLKGPVAVTGEASKSGYNGVGVSKACTFLYLFTFGNASIDKAKKNGSKFPERVKVTHIDYEWKHFLGIGIYKLKVYFFDPSKEQK